MKEEYALAFEDSPVIAAVKSDEGLEKCLTSECHIVFILYGDICTIPGIIARIKAAGKIAVVHIDLIAGMSSQDAAVDYLGEFAKADGIISTRTSLVKRAKEKGLISILRMFIIDSMAYENLRKQVKAAQPDMIEVLPGMMPKVIERICQSSKIPVIAGGLISDREDVMTLLRTGVIGVSTTAQDLWFI